MFYDNGVEYNIMSTKLVTNLKDLALVQPKIFYNEITVALLIKYLLLHKVIQFLYNMLSLSQQLIMTQTLLAIKNIISLALPTKGRHL